jgi:hypothetical protein
MGNAPTARQQFQAMQQSYRVASTRQRIIMLEMEARREELAATWLALTGFKIGDRVKLRHRRGNPDHAGMTFVIARFEVRGIDHDQPTAAVFARAVRKTGEPGPLVLALGTIDDIEHVR